MTEPFSLDPSFATALRSELTAYVNRTARGTRRRARPALTGTSATWVRTNRPH